MRINLKNKNTQMAAIVILVIAMVVLFPYLPRDVVGFDPISLQQVQFISNDQFFNAPVYMLTLAVTGSSGHAHATISPQDIGEYNVPPVQRSVDITTTLRDMMCTYRVLNQSTIDINSLSAHGHDVYVQYEGSHWEWDLTPTQTLMGRAYYIDSATIFNYNLDVALDNYSATLSPTINSAQIQDVARVRMLGNLMGNVLCPVPATDAMVYRPVNTDQLILVDKNRVQSLNALMQSAISQYMAGTHPAVNNGCNSQGCHWTQVWAGTSMLDAYNTQITTMRNTPPQISQYCTDFTLNGTETSLQCNPTSPPTIPVLNMYIKASYVGQVIPSGRPRIDGVSVQRASASQAGTVYVNVTNFEGATDSFDAALVCPTNISAVSSRMSIPIGEMRTMQVQFQGSGLIQTCTVNVRSVNTPDNQDNHAVRIEILPYCDLTPRPGHELVWTQYGCRDICINQYSGDTNEADCSIITSGTHESYYAYNVSGFKMNLWDACGTSGNISCNTTIERSGVFRQYYNIWVQGNTPANNHCIGVGIYRTLYNYADTVWRGYSLPFVPSNRNGENLVWLPSPYCAYVGGYGYDSNGALTNGTFSYINPNNGQQQQGSGNTCGNQICETGESWHTCIDDCPNQGGSVCGNTLCEGSETHATCPADCAYQVVCGNGICDTNENHNTCPSDCPYIATCGNNVCDTNETYATCSVDCPPVCGDGLCQGQETHSSCPNDCQAPPPVYVCGDHICQSTENAQTCSQDCTTNAICGNNVCESAMGESCSVCSEDCGACSGGVIPQLPWVWIVGGIVVIAGAYFVIKRRRRR